MIRSYINVAGRMLSSYLFHFFKYCSIAIDKFNMEARKEPGFRAHWKCLLACTLVSMSPFQYGVDFGIIGGLQAMVGFLEVFGEKDPSTPIGWNISSGRQQLISSLMTLGAFIASGTAGFTAHYVGRKPSLWVACAGVFISTAVMQTTSSIGGLYAGRLIIGLSNGLLMTHSQLYLQVSKEPTRDT